MDKIIVLVLSYNGKHLLEDCLSTYLNNDYGNFDVVVIDNGSIDGTKEWVNNNYPTVTVLRTDKNLGYSGGFNFGLDRAFNTLKADYVVITNNDVKVPNNVISELHKVAKSNDTIGFVTGKVYYFDQPNVFQTVGYYPDELRWIGGHIGNRELDKGQYDNDRELFMSDDIFMMVSRKVYLTVGGYNTLFRFQGEQADWQARAKKIGFKIYFAHKAKIWHKESMTIGKSSPFKTYYDVRNTLLPPLLHMDEKFNRKFFKWYFKNLVLVPFIKNSIKLKFSYSWAILRGFLSAMTYSLRSGLFKFKYLI